MADIKERFNKWRWKKLSSGYIIDKLIINIFFALIMLCFFGIAFQNNFDFSYKLYYRCDTPNGCMNPFYGGVGSQILPQRVLDRCVYDWCSWETLPYGFEHGESPKDFLLMGVLISFGGTVGAVLLNHFEHNKGFFKEVENGEDNEEV